MAHRYDVITHLKAPAMKSCRWGCRQAFGAAPRHHRWKPDIVSIARGIRGIVTYDRMWWLSLELMRAAVHRCNPPVCCWSRDKVLSKHSSSIIVFHPAVHGVRPAAESRGYRRRLISLFVKSSTEDARSASHTRPWSRMRSAGGAHRLHSRSDHSDAWSRIMGAAGCSGRHRQTTSETCCRVRYFGIAAEGLAPPIATRKVKMGS